MALLSDADCHRIEAAVARVEEQSGAEFVVALVGRSASYSRYRALAAAAWAIAFSMLYFRYVPWGAEPWALLLQIPAGLGAWALLGIPAIHRRLIPRDEAERAVQGTAYRLFAERGVHRTTERTGILLLISELEHRVVLLGDTGIDERVGREGWDHHVARLVRRIREGKTAEGVLEVIERLEGSLAEKVPRSAIDVNELPNRVVREP